MVYSLQGRVSHVILCPKSAAPEKNREEILEERQDQETEYVPEALDLYSPDLAAFSNVFARFQLPPEDTSVRSILLRGCLFSSVPLGKSCRDIKRRGYLFR